MFDILRLPQGSFFSEMRNEASLLSSRNKELLPILNGVVVIFSACMFSYTILLPRHQCSDKVVSPIVNVVISLCFISSASSLSSYPSVPPPLIFLT